MQRLIRSGTVTALNEEEASARVKFHDTKMISKELKVLEHHTNKTKKYSMPSIREEVLCVFLPHAPSVGYIIGSYYTKKNLPLESGKIETIVYEDGTKVKYDMETSLMEVECVGDIVATCQNFTGIVKEDILVTTKTLTASVTEDASLECKNAIITATDNIDATCKSLSATASADLTLTAPNITLDGAVKITKDVTCDKNVNCIDTITSIGSVIGHKHTGNLGNPTTPMNT